MAKSRLTNKISFALYVVLLVLHVASIGLPYWKVLHSFVGIWGMWLSCTPDLIGHCETWFGQADYVTTYFLVCFGLLSGSVLLLLLALCTYLPWLCAHNTACTRSASLTFIILSGSLGTSGVILLAVQEHNKYNTIPNGWAFWMCGATSSCLIIHGLVSSCCTQPGQDQVVPSDGQLPTDNKVGSTPHTAEEPYSILKN